MGGGRPARTAGWGSVVPSDPVQLADHLEDVSMRMVGEDRCKETWPNYFSNLDRVCAESPQPGQGTCRGDSGGGLVVPVEVGTGLGRSSAGLGSPSGSGAAATGSGCRRSTSSVRAIRVQRTSAGRCAAGATTATGTTTSAGG
jgi:hypothetical protein